MTRFLDGSIRLWNSLAKASSGDEQIIAAVSYLTDATALKFKDGDLLVADLSVGALKSGVSSAAAARRLAERGVELYNHPGLHAKVVVIGGRRLFAGSMNLSLSSREKLVEAGLETEDKQAVRDAVSWIMQLKGQSEEVTPAILARMEKVKVAERKPYNMRGPTQSARKNQGVAWWLLGTSDGGWERVYGAEDIEVEKTLMSSPRFDGYRIWSKEELPALGNRVAVGDGVIWQHMFAPDWRSEYSPPGVVIKKIVRKDAVSLFIAYDKRDRRQVIQWKKFRPICRSVGWNIESWDGERRIPRKMVEALQRKWPAK